MTIFPVLLNMNVNKHSEHDDTDESIFKGKYTDFSDEWYRYVG